MVADGVGEDAAGAQVPIPGPVQVRDRLLDLGLSRGLTMYCPCGSMTASEVDSVLCDRRAAGQMRSTLASPQVTYGFLSLFPEDLSTTTDT